MNKKITKLSALLLGMGVSFSSLAIDLDGDDDGVVDEASTTVNVIANSFFTDNLDSWNASGLYPYTLENRAGIDDLMVGTKNDSRGGSGYIEQEVNLFDLGFSDEVALEQALVANAMQVRFGGWSAGDTAGITLIFKDKDGVIIGAPSIISNASTVRYVWMKRELTSLIPEGTRSISYRVDLSGSDAVSARFDEAFLFIELAEDTDSDDVLNASDIDNDNDGVIDIEFTERNVLLNNDFLTRQTHWKFASLYPYTLENRAGIDDLMVGTKNDSRGGSGYIEQEVNLFDLGFSDEVALEQALVANAMQVRFGGWSAGDTAGITLIFKDKDGVIIGAPSIISNASTVRYVWMKRELTSLIPEGTRSISYRVDLSGSDAVSARFDEAFLFIELAEDTDSDDVLNASDIDNDNDGVIDIEFTERNVLLNNDFLTRQTHWKFASLYPYTLENRAGIDDLMVGTKNDSRGGSGYIEQEVNLFDLGFSDEVALEQALVANAMQVRFGGWSAGDTAGITLIFKDKDGVIIGAPSIISNASTVRYVWMKRELTSLIPEGTRSFSYRVDLSGSDAVSARFDEAYLVLQDMRDEDLDGLANYEEFALGTNQNARDSDHDGMPDGFEVLYSLEGLGLDPLFDDADEDVDSDGLSNFDEFVLGTDINNADTDGDGIADNVDNNPLDFDEVAPDLYSGQLHVLSDTNGDGVSEIGLLSVDVLESKVRLEILNGKDRASLDEIVWVDNYVDTTISLHLIPDMNDNGADEVGVFGIQDKVNNEGKPQIFVRDLKTGNKVGDVYNWVANWKEVSALVLDDMSGDGMSEIAIQGRFEEGNRPQLVVKTGGTNTILGTYSYPDLFVSPQYYQHSDINGDGFAEISTFGRISSNNKIQVKLASGIDAGSKKPAYNFPDNWDDVSWHRLDDSNGDGVDDWGMFGILREDGRPQLINKDGVSPVGALRIYAWPAEMQDAQFFRIPDMNNDGVDEVAAAGRRSNNGRYQFQVQDGTDRNSVLANHNLNLNLESVTYHVLPDLSGDEQVEIGFMGINSQSEYELVIRHGDTLNGEFATYNLGSDWQGAPAITSLGDTDDDGLPDLLVYGQDGDGQTLSIMPL